MQRTSLPNTGDEPSQLTAVLDLQRHTILTKVADLDPAQFRTPHPPSTLTLAGLVKHLAMVEEFWFRVIFLGEEHAPIWRDIDWDEDPDWEFRTAVDDPPAALVERYVASCASSRAAVQDAPSLDQLSVRVRHGGHVDLRWILLHMIEETARHAGHADMIREAMDGSTGY